MDNNELLSELLGINKLRVIETEIINADEIKFEVESVEEAAMWCCRIERKQLLENG